MTPKETLLFLDNLFLCEKEIYKKYILEDIKGIEKRSLKDFKIRHKNMLIDYLNDMSINSISEKYNIKEEQCKKNIYYEAIYYITRLKNDINDKKYHFSKNQIGKYPIN